MERGTLPPPTGLLAATFQIRGRIIAEPGQAFFGTTLRFRAGSRLELLPTRLF